MSPLEITGIVIAIVSFVAGVIGWAGGVFWKLVQLVESVRGMRKDLHIHADTLANHEGRIVRLECRTTGDQEPRRE